MCSKNIVSTCIGMTANAHTIH